jgi:uncharacterized membrane protein
MQTVGRVEGDPDPDHVVTIASLQARAASTVGAHQRLVERVTSQVGRPRTLYLLLAGVSAWVTANLVAPLMGGTAWDPLPCFWLQGALGLYAALVSTTVLTTQIRQQRHAEQRALLELQVNLTSEQKTAKLIALLEELRRDMPSVRNRVDDDAVAMARPVDPKALMIALEDTIGGTTEDPMRPPAR